MTEDSEAHAEATRSILFVDDEPNILNGLRRMVRPFRHKWQAHFATSGAEALQVLDAIDIDILVSDMRMPGMDGAMLLNEVADNYPNTVRILLSGQCDMEVFISTACHAHQFLAKPCDAGTLNKTIERAMALQDLLDNKMLRHLVMQMDILPSPPEIFIRIENALKESNASMEYIGSIIDEDLGMSAKLLQLVNSPFFGFSGTIKTPTQSATLLGVNTLQFIMLHLQAFTILDDSRSHDADEVSKHGMRVAQLAKAIVVHEGGTDEQCSEAYMAGMLHDLGCLILRVNIPDLYQSLEQQPSNASPPVWEVEKRHLGVSHAEVGAYLIGLWGLPERIVDIVRFHHAPEKSQYPQSLPLSAVCVADSLISHDSSGIVTEGSQFESLQHSIFLARSGFVDRMESWKERCKSILNEEDHE